MTASVRRASWFRLLAARTWLDDNYPRPRPYMQLAHHRCDRASECGGVRPCLLALGWAYHIHPGEVWESLEHFARQHGVCPACTLRELFNPQNHGPPLWFGPLLGEFYELENDNAQIAPQIAWAALRAVDADSQGGAVQVLSRADRATVEA